MGLAPKEVSADAGYYSARAVEELYALGVDPFIAPGQTRHGRAVPPAPLGRIPKHLSPRDRMRWKLRTKRGRQNYALRMETVEPVFVQIQAGVWIPAVPATEPGEGQPGMAAHLHWTQSAEAVPPRGQAAWQVAGQRPHPKHQGVGRDCGHLDFRWNGRPFASDTDRNSRRRPTSANLQKKLPIPRIRC